MAATQTEEVRPKTSALRLAESSKYASRIMRFFVQADMIGKIVPADLTNSIANQLMFPFNLRCPLDAIISSIDDLADNTVLTKQKARKVAWRLAVNYDSLKKGIPVPRNLLTRSPMAVQGVISKVNVINKERFGKQEQRLQIALRMWTGPVAGELAFGEFSYRSQHYFNKTLAALPRRRTTLSTGDLQGYYVSCMVEQTKIGFEFKQLWATHGQQKINGCVYKAKHPELLAINEIK